ncbi:MAG: biotin/lipoyl-containing protein, partial [Candidatus Nanopelagicales bacterium]
NFDSLLPKLIVTGRDRVEALERSRRALAEFRAEGIATALPFHRAVVEDLAFAPAEGSAFTVHTRWIETEFDNQIPPYAGTVDAADSADERETVTVEVDGKRLAVTLPAGLGGAPRAAANGAKPSRKRERQAVGAASGDAVAAPMQGTVVKVAVEDGQTVSAGDLIVVLEAMKMEQPLAAHKSGTIRGLNATVGATVPTGTVLCEIAD